MNAQQTITYNYTLIQDSFVDDYPLGVTYAELWSKGSRFSPSASSGTSTWSTFLSSGLAIGLASYTISALEVVALNSPGADVSTYICDDSSTASTILGYLTSTVSAATSTTCDGHSWVVNTCSSITVMCIDCSDPCTATCASHTLLNPAVTTPCSGTFQGVTMFGVGFTQEPPPALILSSKTEYSTYVTLSFSFSEKAIVACSPYASGKAPSTDAELGTFAFTSTTSSVTGGSYPYAATLSITGLIPSETTYDIYCYTQGFKNNVMTLTDVLAYGAISVTTECCKTVTVGVGLAFLTVSGSSANSITLALDYAPTSSLTVAVSVVDSLGTSYSLYPASTTFTSSSVSLSSSFSVVKTAAATSGNRTVTVTLSGASVSEYSSSPIFTHGVSMFVVLAAGVSPPAPKLISAQFSNSGSQLYLTMDAPTSLSPTPTSTFTCSKLFTFRGASSSSCAQSTTSTFVAYLSSSALVVPGDTLSLTTGTYTISAVCSSSVTNCKTVTNPTSVIVATASNPQTPVVAVTAPAYVSITACTQFFIDASSSTGSGGRSWRSVNVSASTANGDATTANSLLKSYQFTSPTLLTSNQFTRGTYSFLVTLCNFLGQCSSGTANTAVLDSGTIPLTTVYGQQSRSVTRNLPFRLTFDSYTTSCSGGDSRSNLVVTLAISRGTDSITMSSIQKQPGAYSLPAYAFPIYSATLSNIYTFALTVTSSLSTLAPSPVYTYVTVVQSSIVAAISGGSTQGVRLGTTATIDGSRTYDPDQNVYGAQTGLTFAFTCNELTPSFSPSCSFIASAASTVDKKFYAATNATLSTGTSSTITLTVSDSTRSSSASVVLQALSALAPVASLAVANNGATTVNAVSALSLSLKVQYSLSTTISLSCAGVTLSDYTSQATSVSVSGSGSYTTTFVIPPNSLPQGSTLVFSLAASSAGQAVSTSSLSIVVNLPPQPGYFSTTTTAGGTTGTALTTSWLFSASNWQSQQLPLSYSFGFLQNGNYLALKGYSQLATMYSIMSQGNDASNYTVTTMVVVLDMLQASTSATASVHVRPNSDPSAGLNAMNALLASGSTSQALACGASSLNTVSCSSAPNCTALHRSACSTVANTCGACLSGYVGSSGPGNSGCTKSSGSAGGVRFSAGEVCTISDDCSGFESCVSGICTVESKSCLNDCSSNGVCLFEDVNYLSAEILDTCLESDPLCIAVCSCDDGFYSSDCSMTLDEYDSAIEQRETLLEVLWNSTQTSDKTSANVQSWLSSLTSVTQAGLDGLDDSALTTYYELVAYIVAVADELDMYYTYVDGIFSLVDLAASTSSSSDRRRLTLDQQFTTNVWFSLQQYISLVMKTLTDGLSFSEYMDRYSITFTAQSSEQTSTLLQTPVSAFESAYGGVVSQNLTYSSNSTKNKFAVVTWRASVFASSISPYFLTNPVSVVVNDISACEESGCDISYDFNNFDTEDYTETPTTYTTKCAKGEEKSTVYDCPDDLSVTVECDGSFSGTVIATCPYYENMPLCSRVNMLGVLMENWTATSFTNSSTLCDAALLSDDFDGIFNETSGSYDVVPIMSSVYHASTLEKFEDISKHPLAVGLIVMTVLLSIGVPAFAYLIWRVIYYFRTPSKEEIYIYQENPLARTGEKVSSVIDGANIDLVAFDQDHDDAGRLDSSEDEALTTNQLTVSRMNRMSTNARSSGAHEDEIPSPSAPPAVLLGDDASVSDASSPSKKYLWQKQELADNDEDESDAVVIHEASGVRL
jgi:hypothetical protein